MCNKTNNSFFHPRNFFLNHFKKGFIYFLPLYIKVKLMLSSYEKGRDLNIFNLNDITFYLTYQDIVERKTL